MGSTAACKMWCADPSNDTDRSAASTCATSAKKASSSCPPAASSSMSPSPSSSTSACSTSSASVYAGTPHLKLFFANALSVKKSSTEHTASPCANRNFCVGNDDLKSNCRNDSINLLHTVFGSSSGMSS
jgi:hypothetical protein